MTDSETPTKATNDDTLLDRETLYKLVWSEPMLKVAARFGVSSNYMARICTRLNVPKPSRGYWAKKAVGKAPQIPPLPEPTPRDELAWVRPGQQYHKKRILPKPPASSGRGRKRRQVNFEIEHPLIKGAKEHFESGRLSREADYLKPSKRLLVDLIVTKGSLDRAFDFGNRLFWSLEERGHDVVFAPTSEKFWRASVDERERPTKKEINYNNLWSPSRCTVVYIGTVAIGLTIIESSEDVEVRYVNGKNGKYVREEDYTPSRQKSYGYERHWTTTRRYPTGRLCLQAYSPYPGTDWSKQWRETKKRDLGRQTKTMMRTFEREAPQIAKMVEEEELQTEIRRQEWEKQRVQRQKEVAERRAAQAYRDSKAELLEVIDRWAEATKIEAFFQDLERRVEDLVGQEKTAIEERIRLARDMIDSVNALDHLIRWKSPKERISKV